MRTHITTMGTNIVFQDVFLSQLSMEFVTKENDEATIGFMHVHCHTALAEFPIISHLTHSLLPVQIVPRFVLFSYYACILAASLQVCKSYCSFIVLFSHEFH